MNKHELFRPVSKYIPRNDIGVFEVPAEDYSALSVVMLCICFGSLLMFIIRGVGSFFDQPFRFFSMVFHTLFIEWQERRINHKEVDRSSPPSIQHVVGFIVSISILIVVLGTVQSADTLVRAKDIVSNNISHGVQNLTAGVALALSSNRDGAFQLFKKSEHDFDDAQLALDRINPIVMAVMHVTPILSSKISSAEYAIRAGKDIALSAQIATKSFDTIMTTNAEEKQQVVTKLIRIKETLSLLAPLIRDAQISFEKIDGTSLPSKYGELFDSSRIKLTEARQTIILMQEGVDAVLDSMGTSTLRRYLLLFQNNAELRATGGFLGSFALIDIMNGEIKHIEIPPGGPYDLRGSFHERLNPPEPLRIIADEWNFQDANWWADFPTSAQKILWFYEKSGGPTVDGVIAINASMFPKILSLIGPLSLKNYNKELSADTALLEIQKAVELEYDKTVNKPKQIISDLFPLIIKTFSESHVIEKPEFLALVLEAFTEKDIQIYFRNNSNQKLAQKLNITGEMKKFQPDYSMIVSTNIGGGKSDAVLATKVAHTITIENDGSMDVSIEIQRSHKGISGDQFIGMQHNDYMRFYAPLGSVLIGATGFSELPEGSQKPLLANHIDDKDLMALQTPTIHVSSFALDQWNEKDMSVFGGWLFTKPSTESNAIINYRLPFTVQQLFKKNTIGTYALLIQRQSGSTISSYTTQFIIPDAYKLDWKYGGTMNEMLQHKGFAYHLDAFRTDQYLGFGIKK